MELIMTLSSIERLEQIKQMGINNIIIHHNGFSDRANKFFDLFEIQEILTISKKLKLNVFLNLNTLIHEFELKQLKEFLLQIESFDFKGIYFNDLSYLHLLKDSRLFSLLIYNPDTLLTSYSDINNFLDLGIDSAVISKEITYEEINEIIKNSNKKLDLIVFGYLNMSYSRRHYIRNYLNVINSDYKVNKPLELIEATRTGRMPIMENQHGCSLFTEYVLCTLDLDLDGIRYGIVDDVFLDFSEVETAIKTEKGKVLETLNHKFDRDFSSGYMYLKTNLVK